MLTTAERTVETLIARGARLEEIEERIDELPLDGDERSALWLLAWSAVTNPAVHRRVVLDERGAPTHARK
ncbi:MAG TPA: hypothetical protein VG295_14240 [Solirubrobacteraceae bacterium]|jgi:hypothetical protein|nr:hypothetical protein [Solirubrobacteraceae bacterium]